MSFKVDPKIKAIIQKLNLVEEAKTALCGRPSSPVPLESPVRSKHNRQISSRNSPATPRRFLESSSGNSSSEGEIKAHEFKPIDSIDERKINGSKNDGSKTIEDGIDESEIDGNKTNGSKTRETKTHETEENTRNGRKRSSTLTPKRSRSITRNKGNGVKIPILTLPPNQTSSIDSDSPLIQTRRSYQLGQLDGLLKSPHFSPLTSSNLNEPVSTSTVSGDLSVIPIILQDLIRRSQESELKIFALTSTISDLTKKLEKVSSKYCNENDDNPKEFNSPRRLINIIGVDAMSGYFSGANKDILVSPMAIEDTLTYITSNISTDDIIRSLCPSGVPIYSEFLINGVNFKIPGIFGKDDFKKTFITQLLGIVRSKLYSVDYDKSYSMVKLSLENGGDIEHMKGIDVLKTCTVNHWSKAHLYLVQTYPRVFSNVTSSANTSSTNTSSANTDTLTSKTSTSVQSSSVLLSPSSPLGNGISKLYYTATRNSGTKYSIDINLNSVITSQEKVYTILDYSTKEIPLANLTVRLTSFGTANAPSVQWKIKVEIIKVDILEHKKNGADSTLSDNGVYSDKKSSATKSSDVNPIIELLLHHVFMMNLKKVQFNLGVNKFPKTVELMKERLGPTKTGVEIVNWILSNCNMTVTECIIFGNLLMNYSYIQPVDSPPSNKSKYFQNDDTVYNFDCGYSKTKPSEVQKHPLRINSKRCIFDEIIEVEY